MTKKCELTGKTVITGNTVSKAKNRTRRKFYPNINNASLFSESLGKAVRLRVSSNALRTIDKKGGFDSFLISAKNANLSSRALLVKKAINKKITNLKSKPSN